MDISQNLFNYTNMFLKRKDNLVLHGNVRYLERLTNINWRITSNCNFMCKYCNIRNHKKEFPTLDFSKKIIDFIAKLEFERGIINLTGGEATTHPKFLDIIKYMANRFSKENKQFEICLLTNLSKPIDYYEEFFSICNEYQNVDPNIFASFHKEFINLETFVDRYRHLKIKYNINSFAFMIHEPSCVDLFNSLLMKRDYKIQYHAAPVFTREHMVADLKEPPQIYYGLQRNYREIVNIYYENGEYKYNNDPVNDIRFRGFACAAFEKSMFINANGDIYSCILCNGFYKPLSIFQEGIHKIIKEKKVTICPVYKCTCDPSITKISLKHYKTLKDVDLNFIRSNMKRKYGA